MHAVFGQVVHAHWLKGAGTDVQGQPGQFDAAFAQHGEHRLVEVQARCRRGDGAGMPCEDGLVTGLVVCFCVVGNVRGQRQPAMRLDQRPQVAVTNEFEREEFVLLAGSAAHRQRDRPFENDAAAWFG